jgi:DNA repair protein RecN (Recombination protein N)
MLRELAVRDLALIDRARVVLSPGFTVITGETGAGKSLLIDALALAMGGRADSSLVRSGADGARVEALFERDPEPLICVRELGAGGRSVARIDDETVTAGRLAAVVGPLVEIHGQHEQQRLLQAAWQRDVLDAYGDHGTLRETVARAVAAWRANEAALRELAVEPADLERRVELAEHAAAEIEAAAIQPGEVDQLRGRLAVATNATRIAGLLAEAHSLLADESSGARDGLARAARAAADLAALDEVYADVAQRLAGVQAEADDLALELRRRTELFAEEAIDATAIEERLSLLYGLLRKYGDDEAAVIEHGERARAEVERLRGMDAERARREADGVRLAAAAQEAADRLSQARHAAAAQLGRAVSAALEELGFPADAFSVGLAPIELDESGADSVTFLLAPNPGEPPRSLARIASGGEMSRVALALKVVLARADATPTLVFDEIDAGIGGRSADPIGRSLWTLARDHQVICVTHLPQIAAHADVHLRITKRTGDGRTVTAVDQLDDPERQAELAQMLGGQTTDHGALAAAAELIERARAKQRTKHRTVGAV